MRSPAAAGPPAHPSGLSAHSSFAMGIPWHLVVARDFVL